MKLKTKRGLSLSVLAAVGLMASAAFAADTTGLTDTTIKVGVMGPFSGNASSYSKAQIGEMAYYKMINDQGGVHGRKFELIQEDTACQPAKGIAAAKKLISQEQVFMMHGNSCSGVAMAVRDIVVDAGVPWIIAHAVNPNISMPPTPNVFHGVPAGPAYGYSMGKFVMSKPGTKNVIMVEHSNDWAKSYADPTRDYMKEKGIEPSMVMTMERGQTDATAQVLKIKQAKPDFIVASLYEAETVIFLKDMKKYGVTDIPVMGAAGTDLENTLARIGDIETVKNYYVPHAFIDTVDGPGMKKWNDMILKYYPDETITGFSAISIGSAVAVVEALKNAGRDLTREKFIAEMDKIKNFDTGVFAAPITWSADDRHGVKESASAGFVNGKPTVMKGWNQPM
ncbi:MAG: ABC transporter substrate-binding protein [Rhodospirillales bacterium]